MSISSYLKQIGRGSKGASDLSREHAKDLFIHILNQDVTDLEIGAFCLAMRIKGETAEELAGFYDAALDHLPRLSCGTPTILLPSYNGARKTMLMTPLLGKLLADLGFSVLVHGLHEEAARTSSEDVFKAQQWSIAKTTDDIVHHLHDSKLVYCPLAVLCPALARLLAVRQTIGLRNSGHILAKLLNPFESQSLQVCNYTHPAYPTILDEFFTLHPANVILMRGHEDEPVASPRRVPSLHIKLNQSTVSLDTEAVMIEEDTARLDTIKLNETTKLYAACLSQAASPPATLIKQVQVIQQAMQTLS